MFPQSGPTWTMSKGFIKLTDSPLAAEWIVSQIAACFNKMTAEGAWRRSADLIHENVVGLSVLGGLRACVRTHTHLSRCLSVCSVCATIRLNPQLSLTGLAEWTAEVYHCLLISSDSHQPIRARTFSEWPQRDSPPWAGVNTLWPLFFWDASKQAPISLCQAKSNKSKLSGGNRCSRHSFLCEKQFDSQVRINPINESLRQ